MATDPMQKSWAAAVNIVFPNQPSDESNGRGTHMNISGMAMTKYAPNRAAALQLMEFLTTDIAQKMYAELNGEYPVNQNIAASNFLIKLGDFKRDTINLSEVAANRISAAKMVDRVRFND